MSESRTTRLLPWVSPDGKTCFLVSDGGGEGGLSRVADRIEDVQLDMADGLLDHAADLLADGRATDRQLRFLGEQLSSALRDVRRVAESRGGKRTQDITAAEGGDGHPGQPWTPPPPPPPDGEMPPGDGTHRK
ncbi:hypothetical protein ACFXN2_29110 [Streptomyces kronopolitis]|uniref:hypothetical protein n=1 Tax=Streptomyces TaxID=1883 RepID=UPI0024A0DA43|nr:hypothetical protein [Streptomyces sp. NBRC 13847]GLW14171.1 hypothetical protein Stsp01_09140 [Streptomyces sp. NBRC 13847]